MSSPKRPIPTPSPFTVIIVGGSIAGLTLSHCLSRSNIHHVVIEKRPEVAPQEGASVGMMPNGARILDQMGLWTGIEKQVHPLESAHVTFPDGYRYTGGFPGLLRERFGYPIAFFDRQKLLSHLATTLPEKAKQNLHLGKKVEFITQMGTSGKWRVYCTDGSYHDGDLVVGADGVHSKVRSEMWRISSKEGDNVFDVDAGRKKMNLTFACAFGISSPQRPLSPGLQITCYNNGFSIQTMVGKNGRTYWFLPLKLDRQYNYAEAPRFSRQDAIRRCEEKADTPFWEGLTFGDLWKRTETFGMTGIEEFVLDRWHWRGVVCIGDAVHKTAPQTGQGANCAIEDASALCNVLNNYLYCNPSLEPKDLDTMLHSFTTRRRTRMQAVAHSSELAARVHARDTLFLRLLGRYFMPFAGDVPANKASQMIAGEEVLENLPVVERPGDGWERFKMREGGSRMTPVMGVVVLVVLVLWLCAC